eukprot:TRINITY_DN36617_c0_g1_i1.p1 TRINITY_DN36617_c0_g1~~TRINITY_DN36617_c0_g1_i1.p1  ORF type:complete len:400 (+),score=92.80 TRINITY_DN36617_c0_g1_i1:36-1235(+)
MAILRLSLLLSVAAVAARTLLSSDARLFGHSIKNGPLPSDVQVTTFEHSCTTPPCIVTQIHVPSIYPPSGQPWNWENGIIRIFLDGQAPLNLTLGDLAVLGPYGHSESTPQDGSPYGIALFGKTAKSGGVYSTMRIPFQKTLRVTIQAAVGTVGQSTFWFIIRGLEATPVVLGDLTLPDTAALSVSRVVNVTLADQQLVTLLTVPPGKSGALVMTQFSARGLSGNYGYLEACMRAYIDGAAEPMFLSSGAEDYFLSASYFDEGMFKTPNSGLTFKDGKGGLSVYKVHDRDPVIWRDGFRMEFRNCETTAGCGNTTFCPNQWCGAQPGTASQPNSDVPFKDLTGTNGEEAVYSTTIWLYTWPTAQGQGHRHDHVPATALESLQRKYDRLVARLEALEARD